MSATALTALTLLVGLFGGLIYWWGERSSFPWMKFGAAAVLVMAIGVAAATWPDHHVVANAGADQADSSQTVPSLSPSTVGPGVAGTLSDPSQDSGQSATSDSAPPAFIGSLPIFGVGGFPPEPAPSPKPSSTKSPNPTHSPTPSPTDPSPSPTDPSPSPTDPSPSPTDPSPSPTDPSPSPTDPSPSPTDPSPSPTDPSPSPTDPSPSPSEPSPSPSEPSPSPTILPEPSPTPGFRPL